MTSSPHWDQSVFDRTLAKYKEASKKTLARVINTKAYYVARKAVWFTPKADTKRIAAQLGQVIAVKESRMTKKGKLRMTTRKTLTLVKGTQHNAPLAALIINARGGSNNQKGLYGSRMSRAIQKLLAARKRSVAFIKSGWLPAIKKLAPLSDRRGAPATDSAAAQVGREKGTATPAKDGFNPSAEIVNLATTRRDKKSALVRYGAPGLQKAFDDEVKSMNQYIEAKMKPDADKFNQQQR
jgi:hypothetical protein